jgi:hypothetical protein
MTVLELIPDKAIFPDRASVQEALNASRAAGEVLTLQVSAEMSDAEWDRVAAAILKSHKIITV